MAKPKILIADPISEIGIDELKADPQLDVVVQIGIKEPDLLASVDQYRRNHRPLADQDHRSSL